MAVKKSAKKKAAVKKKAAPKKKAVAKKKVATKKKVASLTSKQQLFVDEFLKDRNGKQAAIRAKYSPNTAESQASRLLSNAKVAKAIAEAVEKRSKATGIDADWVLKQAVAVHERCMQISPVLDRKGKQIYVDTPDGDIAPAFTFDAPGANKSLEIVGKHVNVQAFKDRVEHSGKIDLSGKTDKELQDIINGSS